MHELADAIKVWYLNQSHCVWVLEGYYVQKSKKIGRFMDEQMRFLKYMSRNCQKHIDKIMKNI